MNYILSIDQGTTGTTALIIDENLNLISKVNSEYEQLYPNQGWVEHNPSAIWSSVRTSVIELIKDSKIDVKDIKCIGITNQRETVSLWNKKTSKFYHNFIVWQDRRTSLICKEFKDKGFEPIINKKTGLLLDPYFSGTKIKWILENCDLTDNLNDVTFGTIDTFLVYKLTGNEVCVTDVSNASRTMLLNIHTLKWDEELLNIFNIPKEILPEVKSSSEIYGYTKGLDFLPDGIPISSIIGDQQGALFGQSCFNKGESKCTYGTGSFILMNTGTEPIISTNKLLTTVAWKVGEEVNYAIEGSCFIAGALVQWLRDEMKFFSCSSEIEVLAQTVDSSNGVTIVPALTGLGAPYWKADVFGMIYGISRNTNRGHISRAALEAIALQNYELLKAMENDTNIKLISLKVDGRASVNDILMQFQSDVLNVILTRPKIIETTALGAAMLAGLGIKLFKSIDELKEKWKLDKVYSPNFTDYTEKVLNNWKISIKKILS